MVPFAETSFFKNTKYKSAKLVITKNEQKEAMFSRIIVFEADSTETVVGDPLDSRVFTGYIYQVNNLGHVGLILKCKNGRITEKVGLEILGITASQKLQTRDDEDDPGCYNFGSTTWQRIGRFFSRLFSRGGSNNGSDKDVPEDYFYFFPSRNIVGSGMPIEEIQSSGGGSSVQNYLSNMSFSNVSIMNCSNSTYEDILTFNVTLADDETVNTTPALIILKKYGHNWANVYLNAAKEYYTNHYTNFGTALKYVESHKTYNTHAYATGISPSSSDPFVKAAYSPLISAYDAMMNDYAIHQDCNSFNYSLGQSFEHFDNAMKENYLNEALKPNDADKAFLSQNPQVRSQLFNFLEQNTTVSAIEKQETAKQHLRVMIENPTYLSANQQAGFPAIGSNQWEKNVVKPFFGPELMIQYSVWCVILKHQNPTWPDWKIRAQAFWNTTKEIIHTGLDILGLIPGGGEIFDGINGIFYTIEGDGLNATLSFAATIPIAGWIATGSKYAIKTIGISGRTYKLSYKVVNGII